MDANRKLWNQNQKELRQKLPKGEDFPEMQQLLLKHHAMVHSASMADYDCWSFEDEVWQDFPEADARRVPTGQEHSIIWIFWHIARIEDMTMNMLVAGSPTVLQSGNYLEQMNVPFRDTGNEITPENMAILNESMDVTALRNYRRAVGQRTQAIMLALESETVLQDVDPARIQQLWKSGVVVPEAKYVVDYWSKRTIAGLLLMPATRHNFIHLNEASRIKQAILK